MPHGQDALTVGAMAIQDGQAAMDPRPAATDGARPWTLDGPHRAARPVSVAVLIAAAVGVVVELPGSRPGVIVLAVAALIVAGAGVAFIVWPRRSAATGTDTAALVAVGLAGAVLAVIAPNSFVIVFLSLAGLGMRLPPRSALLPASAVFAATNLALILATKISVASLASLDIGAGFLFVIGAFTRSSRIAHEQARVAQARAEELVAQLQATQAARSEAAALTERTRLAREIHDILAHALSGLVLALDTMELLGRQAGRNPQALEQLLGQVSRGQRIARDGLADTKRAVAALRGDELPGPAVLEQLVREAAAATGVQARLSVAGPERQLSPEVGLAIYRTAQEALTNSAKYSGPGASVELMLSYADDAVVLVVEDTRSDNVPPVGSRLTFGGYGLTGMRERAELLGGSLTAGPTECGFAVQLRLPAAASAAGRSANGIGR
jgi:signal transduction histidine kinase